MGGKARKKPQVAGTGALTIGVSGTTLPKYSREDRSDYFVGDLDAGGITLSPPNMDDVFTELGEALDQADAVVKLYGKVIGKGKDV